MKRARFHWRKVVWWHELTAAQRRDLNLCYDYWKTDPSGPGISLRCSKKLRELSLICPAKKHGAREAVTWLPTQAGVDLVDAHREQLERRATSIVGDERTKPAAPKSKPILVECEECSGTGQVPMACVNCNAELTEADLAAYPEAEACIPCCKKEEQEEREALSG